MFTNALQPKNLINQHPSRPKQVDHPLSPLHRLEECKSVATTDLH